MGESSGLPINWLLQDIMGHHKYVALSRSTPHAECFTTQHDYNLQISESGVNKYILLYTQPFFLSTSLRLVVSFDIHVQVRVILGFKKGQIQYSARST